MMHCLSCLRRCTCTSRTGYEVCDAVCLPELYELYGTVYLHELYELCETVCLHELYAMEIIYGAA